jgi:hypothetical protein
MSELDVLFENKVEYDGEDFRHAFDRPLGEGVEGYGDLRVTPGAAADTVDVAAGIGFVRGDGLNDLGLYRCRNDATKNSAAFEAGGIAAPDATKPRLDQIIARVYDDAVDSEGAHKWRLAVLKGTATAGDTLDKREGAAALPNSAMLIADVLVPAGAPAVLEAGAIRDRRPFCYPIVPPLLTDVDMVPLIPVGNLAQMAADIAHASHDVHQAAIACYLPRRITSATKIRWKYAQNSGTALAGNYVIAIFDASGRKIIDTGSVAFAGAVSTTQVRSETIAATTFEAGVYYVFIGVDTTEGGGKYTGYDTGSTAGTAGNPRAVAANAALAATTGGLTVPSTLLGLTDTGAASTTITAVPVPAVCLSVG